MSLLERCVLEAARTIACNEGREQPVDDDYAHAEWALAGILQAFRQEPSTDGPSLPDVSHGGNIHERGPTALGGPVEVLRANARLQGFEGEACGTCMNFTMVRNGTCLKCNSCGATTGCS